MEAFNSAEIGLDLPAIPEWSQHGQRIQRVYQFSGFMDSIDFVDRIAGKAQRMKHYPEIDIRGDAVTLTLTTHEEGGLTDNDFILARECDETFSLFR